MGADANNIPAEMLSYTEDPQFGKATPGKIAMWIFLVTDAMSFAGLLIAYAILRATGLIKRFALQEHLLGEYLSIPIKFILSLF